MLQQRPALALMLAVFTVTTGTAQETTKELDPVTVTSGFSPATASRTGRNILVLPGSQFNRLPVSSVDELLRYVPGIEVQARGPMGTQSDIVMRGGTFQQVLVIVDGVRLNDPFSGHFSTYFPIAPSEIERIEVLKGASSALYGSEAVGGVIHIITKTFAARQGQAYGSLGAQVSAGSYGLINTQAGGNYSDGRTGFGAGILSNNAQGQQQRGIKGYFHVNAGSLSVSHFIRPNLRLALRAGYDERSFAAQNFYSTALTDTSKERVKTAWNQLSLAYEKTRDRYSLEAGFKGTSDNFAFNTLVAANQNESRLWQVLLRNEHRFSDRLTTNGAVQFINRGIQSNDRGNHNETQVAGIATLNYAATPGLTIVPALRLDWQEQRGFELVPQLALSYRLHDLQLRGSVGKTIRDADFTERYNNFQKPVVPSGNKVGNPSLQAERALAWEVGADYLAAKSFKVSTSFFQRFHTGLIDYVNTPYAAMPRRDNLLPTGTYGLALNTATVDITGAELDLQFTHRFRTHHQLQASAGLTWAEAKSSGSSTGYYLTSFAKYLFNFQAVYSNRHFLLSATGLYKQRAAAQAPTTATAIKAELSKDYFVLSGKAQFFVLPEKLGLFVQADNLLDRSYSDLLGAQMPGRWWQGGIQFKLN